MNPLLLKVCLFFINAGAFSFGGGYGVLYMLQNEVVSKNAWLTSQQFVDIVAIAEMTPGPISVNASTFVGYTLFGILGGILCTLCIVAVPFALALIVSIFFQKFKDNCHVISALKGIRPVVIGLIASVSLQIAEISFVDSISVVIFAAATFFLFKFKINPIWVMLASGFFGIAIYAGILS
ncbi:MAG: chromate transporter [Clostridia bacterium]|nr:chromate transporter [Clostridia bacterium]